MLRRRVEKWLSTGDEGSFWRIELLLLAAAVGLLLPALQNGFVWDDINVIVNNRRLLDWNTALEMFRHSAVWVIDRPVAAMGTYRPLAVALMVVERHLFGLNPIGFHLTNLLLHGACTVLLFRFLRQFVKSWRVGLIISLFFAWHPVALEAVVWVNGRSEPLAMLFGLWALGFQLRNLDQRSWKRGIAICGLLLLAMLGKETGMLFVGLAGLIVLRSAGRLTIKGVAWHGIFLIAPLLIYGGVRGWVLAQYAVPIENESLLLVLMVIPQVLFRALQGALVPTHQGVIMLADWMSHNPYSVFVTYGGLTVVLVALGWVAVVRRRWTLVFGLLWWLVGILPAAFLALLNWPGLSRWIYIPLPGLLLVIAELGALLPVNRSIRYLWRFWPIPLFLYGAVTVAGIGVWRSETTLWTQTVVENPENPYALGSLGIDAFWRGEYKEAVARLSASLQKKPENNRLVKEHLILSMARLGHCAIAENMLSGYQVERIPRWVGPFEIGSCWERADNPSLAARQFKQCASLARRCAEALQRVSQGEQHR